MSPATIERLAAAFWEQLGERPPPSRDLEPYIPLFPGTIFLTTLEQVSPRSIRDWFERRPGLPLPPLAVHEREMLGCVVAYRDCCGIFIDGKLPRQLRRVIVAHEFSHFLAEYDWPRRRIFRRFGRHDYDTRNADPVAQLRTVLDRRAGQTAIPGSTTTDSIHTLLRRGFMAAAERTALWRYASTRWKVVHGVPAPLELLTGSGSMELIDQALPILNALLLADSRWIFFPDTLADRALLTIVNALNPGELAILQTGKPMLEAIIETANYAPGYRQKVEAFASRLGQAMVVGGYRATRYAPAQLFIAHADLAVEASILAMTDSRLNPHQGSPLLLQLAGIGARTGMGLDAFRHLVEAAYAQSQSLDLFRPGRVHIEQDG